MVQTDEKMILPPLAKLSDEEPMARGRLANLPLIGKRSEDAGEVVVRCSGSFNFEL